MRKQSHECHRCMEYSGKCDHVHWKQTVDCNILFYEALPPRPPRRAPAEGKWAGWGAAPGRSGAR